MTKNGGVLNGQSFNRVSNIQLRKSVTSKGIKNCTQCYFCSMNVWWQRVVNQSLFSTSSWKIALQSPIVLSELKGPETRHFHASAWMMSSRAKRDSDTRIAIATKILITIRVLTSFRNYIGTTPKCRSTGLLKSRLPRPETWSTLHGHVSAYYALHCSTFCGLMRPYVALWSSDIITQFRTPYVNLNDFYIILK